MKLMKRVAALVLALSLCLTLCACGDKSEIKDTIEDFEEACQTLDLNDILDCLDPTVAEVVGGGAGLIGKLTGQSSEELLDSIVPALFGADFSSAFLQSIDIKVKDVAVNGANATAMCTVTYLYEGQEQSKDATFELVKEGVDDDADWYITGIDFN